VRNTAIVESDEVMVSINIESPVLKKDYYAPVFKIKFFNEQGTAITSNPTDQFPQVRFVGADDTTKTDRAIGMFAWSNDGIDTESGVYTISRTDWKEDNGSGTLPDGIKRVDIIKKRRQCRVCPDSSSYLPRDSRLLDTGAAD